MSNYVTQEGLDKMKAELEQLEREERNVYETRLRKIKSAGETASTKLLIPMGGLLGMVLIVLVVPAFFTIQI